jgi:arylsulfatase A-like enzyme
LPDYYACVARIDDAVGTIRATLAETGLDKNTILAFVSDHGCHFRTRNTEYKRSPHDSSIHVPLIIEGPGFNRSLQIPELVSLVDLAPTLLESAGVPAPRSMQGRSFLPLLDRKTGNWRNEVFFEMSEFLNGRGIRTPQYTYAAVAPPSERSPGTYLLNRFAEYVMYDSYADPHQLVNLAGRAPYSAVAAELRERLAGRVEEAAGSRVTIEPTWFPYA